MGRLAVVGGHSILGVSPADDLGYCGTVRSIPVSHHTVTVVDADDVVFLQRHGVDGYTPSHRIDHHAHAHALARLACDRVLGISSVGALHARHHVGTVLVADDFIALAQQPDSRFVDERGHMVPRFSPDWRARVLAAWDAHATTPPVDGGVYWQVTGPRFETAAEVRYLAAFADVVGMTVGSECIACTEQALAYATVCVVDNLANGVGDAPLTVEEFEAGKAANRSALVDVLRAVIPELAR